MKSTKKNTKYTKSNVANSPSNGIGGNDSILHESIDNVHFIESTNNVLGNRVQMTDRLQTVPGFRGNNGRTDVSNGSGEDNNSSSLVNNFFNQSLIHKVLEAIIIIMMAFFYILYRSL